MKWYLWIYPLEIEDIRMKEEMIKQWILQLIPVYDNKKLAEENWGYLSEVIITTNNKPWIKK